MLIQTAFHKSAFCVCLMCGIYCIVAVAANVLKEIQITLSLICCRHIKAPHLPQYFVKIGQRENRSTFRW